MQSKDGSASGDCAGSIGAVCNQKMDLSLEIVLDL